MCGILFSIDKGGAVNFYKMKHRGPDSSILKDFDYQQYRVRLGFHRLSIIGRENGEQPFFKDGVYLLCNGEIYNHKELKEEYSLVTETQSDCEVILALYLKIKNIKNLSSILRGEFAFVLFDTRKGVVHYGRDKYGVRPLYFRHNKGKITLASELKGLPGIGYQVTPNQVYSLGLIDGEYTITKFVPSIINKSPKEELILAVKERLQSEVPIGFLLSGGLDSSLILSIASKLIPTGMSIDVFTVGFSEDAPDVINSKIVINYLEQQYQQRTNGGSGKSTKKRFNHHVVIFTIEEGIAVIPEVVKSIESFDTTTVRASTPMWLIARYIAQNTNVKVILSGEGSDEINGSYLYFHYAPSDREFEKERQFLTSNIHLYDGRRADRTISAFGLELRTPFLERTVGTSFLQCDQVYSMMKMSGVEKHYLRSQFEGYLPREILWRTKAAFSDAVSYKWKESLKERAEMEGKEDKENDETFSYHLPPKTPEERWYRRLFETYYPGNALEIPYLWLPKWVDTGREPSATVLADVHHEGMRERRDNKKD